MMMMMIDYHDHPVLPDSMVVFGAIWAFPIKITNHSGMLSKYLRHEILFLGSVVAYWYKLCSL